MDVRLPNGQVVKNVPQGMSKADLVAKLRANGHDMSWVDGPAQTPEPVAATDEPAAAAPLSVGQNLKRVFGMGSDAEQEQAESEYDNRTGVAATVKNVGNLTKRSGAKLLEGVTELPGAVASVPGGVVGSTLDAFFNPGGDDGGDYEDEPATDYAGKLASATRQAAAPITESKPVVATREWAQGKEKEALDALTPMARRAIELSLVEHDEENGLTLGEGATDPWWWTANIIDLGVQMAPGMGATALSARMSYAAKYRQALGELSTQKIPQSVAIKEAEKQAMKAATRSAVITGGLTEGATGGGGDAAQTRAAIDSLNEETLMAYPGYMELRDQGMTHEQARAQIAGDKAAAVAISTGALIGLTGAPMNAYFGKLAAKFGKVAKTPSKLGRLAEAGKAALGEGAQEFVQEGGEQIVQNKAEQPITGVDTWDGVLENAITGAVLGGVVGGGIGGLTHKSAKAKPSTTDGPPSMPPPKGPVETAEAAYDAASNALAQGETAARDPNVNIKYAEIQKLRDAKKKAMVDFTRELLHSGQIKEADQSAVSEALKQAEAEGISATSRKTAGGDVSPARDAALEAAANAEMMDEADANDLISNGLAKISPRGAMVLTPEGRRQRKLAQMRAEADKEEAAKPKNSTTAKPKTAEKASVNNVVLNSRIANTPPKQKITLPAEKRAIAAEKATKRALRKAKPAVELAAAKATEAAKESDAFKAGVQRQVEGAAQTAAEIESAGIETKNPQMRDAFKAALDRSRRARSGLVDNTKTAAFRLKGQPETAEIPGKGKVKIEPVQAAKDASAAYRKSRGIVTPEQTEFARVEPARAKRIAKAFDEMQHAPNDPTVKRAYRAMIDETKAQWQEIKKTGLKIEFIKPGQKDPYAKSPREAIEDVRNNNHLWVFPTDSGFGTDSKYSKDNPMLEDSGEKVGDHQLKNNDVFRVVHDYFGHVQEANGFRADGEENAWRIHAGMYSPLARRAMTTETRGQNSWVNYGPKGEANRTAKSGDTVYADQKIGLLPAEFSAFPSEKLKFKHFSTGTEDQLDLDPEKMGTGAKGAEAKRGGPKVVSLYAEHGETEPEVANGRQRYNVEIPKEDLYDASADSAGLLRQAQVPYGMTTDKDGNTVPVGTRFDMNKFEELVRDAGYLGYHTPEASGILKGQARIFHKYPATREGAVQRQVTGAMRVKRKSSEETVRGHLTPEENARLKKASARKLIEVFDELPAGAELAAAAVAGQAKRGWYRRSAEALSNVFGPDAPRFTALLAALSPQTSVEWNFRNAVAVWVGWEKAGRPTDRKKILFVMRDNLFPGSNRVGKSKVLGAWINNTVRALSAEDPSSVTLSGPKVDSFAANLRGETERVTLDAWMANWAGVSQNLFKGEMNKAGDNPGMRPGYLAFAARVREAAKILSDRTGETWTPSEVQETVWSWAKTLYEQAESFGALATARELVDNQELTDELINSTPDFAGQFADPEISAILRGTVYGPRAARSAGEAAATGRAAGKTAPADQDARYLRKAADRLDALRKTRKEAEDETRAEGATRVSTAPTKGIDAAALESVAARVKAELGVDTKTVNTQADLPGYVQDLIPEGATDVTGMFVEDQITGETEIWFIRDNIDSKGEAYENALHETVGHMGLRAVLGKSYHKTMDGIRASFPAQVASAARRNSIDMNHPDPATNRRLRSLAAEELVAYAAGRVLAKRGALSEQSVWRRIIAKVRDILRNVGLLNSYSNKDIEALIYRARDYFRKPAATRAQEISYRGKLAMAVKNQPDGAPQWLSPEDYLAEDTVGTKLKLGSEMREIPIRGFDPEQRQNDAAADKPAVNSIGNEQITFSPGFDPIMAGDDDFFGQTEVKAFADGQLIGYVTLDQNDITDSTWTAQYVYVNPRYRGKGVAQRMYAAISKRLGRKPAPAKVRTPGGRSMWNSFNRRNVAFSMKNGPVWHSAVEHTLVDMTQESATGAQWWGTLKNAKGVKAEELEWLGLKEWLIGDEANPAPFASDKITRQQLINFVRANKIDVQDVLHGTPTPQSVKQNRDGTWVVQNGAGAEPFYGDTEEEALDRYAAGRTGSAKYQQYQTAGGKNYHELLLTLPTKKVGFEYTDATELPADWKFKIDRQTEAVALVAPTGLNEGRRLLLASEGEELAKAKALEMYNDFERNRQLDAARQANPQFQSGHWHEPNVLAHVRFNERTVDGQKVLFVEEVQSDWHQVGRKRGYQGNGEDLEQAYIAARTRYDQWKAARQQIWKQVLIETAGMTEIGAAGTSRGLPDQLLMLAPNAPGTKNGGVPDLVAEAELQEIQAEMERTHNSQQWNTSKVPNAPFKTTWPELAMKRMIRYAAEHGFDKLAWTSGAMQANRYDLSQQVHSITVAPRQDGGRSVHIVMIGNYASFIVDKDGVVESVTGPDGIEGKPLDEVVGKEMAEKVMAVTKMTKFEDVDLQIGGAGMKGFYDKLLPKTVDKYVKKWGSKTEPMSIQTQAEKLPATRYVVERNLDHVAGNVGSRPWRITAYYREDAPEEFSLYKTEQAAREEAVRLNKAAATPLKMESVHSLPITDEMRGSVLQSQAMFAFKQGPTGNTDLDAFINKIGASPLTLRQRWDNFKQDLKDRTNMGLFDEFHGIYRAGQLAGITVADSGYMDARLSKNAAELTQTIIENGPPIWDDGAPNIGTGLSLLDILKPLKGNTNLWLAYMTGRRADRLMSEGRENLFTPNEIAAALDLARQHPEFDVARQQYNQLQKQVLDFAEQAGVINAQGRALWEHADYIPFHRIVEGGQVKASASGGGGIGFVRNQIKRLTGGKQKIGDPLENIVRNWLSLMDASLKANAGRITVDALNGTGLVTPYKGAIPAAPVVPFSAARQYLAQNPQLAQTFSAIGLNPAALTPQAFAGLQQMVAQNGPAEDDVISVWRNGKREHWKVHDPLLMRSLQNIHSKAWAPIIKILTYPKRIVTKGITLTPQFALKNYWRDVWHVFVQGANSDGTKVTVLPTDSIRGLISTLRNDATAKGLLAAGGSFTEGYVNPGDLSGASKVVRRSLGRATTAGMVLNTPTKIWRFYRDLQNAAENANRVAMYNKARAAGLSRKEAAFAARDLLDFSMRGNNPIVQLIVMSTPFMNARLQGLYRLGSGLAASKAMFISIAMRGMLLTLASAALLARNFDDDRYKALTDQQKSNYWHFFDVFQKGDHFQLPKPFEVGAIFATIPEAIGDAMFTNSEEPDGTLQAAQLVGYTFGQTLNLSPQPQAVWPLLELAINKDTFTGSPILTQGDESVLPEDQRGPRSSASYAALAEAMPDIAPEALRSPKQLEHLGRGYLGNLQDYVLFASDALVREARGEPAAPEGATQDMPGLRDFYRTGPARNTRHVTAMYELAGEAAKIQASIKRNEDAETTEGDARAEKLEEDNAPLLDVADDFKAASKEVTDLKKEQRQIQLDPDMTPAEKRKSIDEIQQEINDIAKDAYDLRPGGKLNPGAAADLLVAPPIARATILRKNNMPATADLLESLG